MGTGLIEKQVIVQWYTPEEKMPEPCTFAVVTFSGKYKNMTCDHALGVAYWCDDGEGWCLDSGLELDGFTIHAWADLGPYKGGNE